MDNSGRTLFALDVVPLRQSSADLKENIRGCQPRPDVFEDMATYNTCLTGVLHTMQTPLRSPFHMPPAPNAVRHDGTRGVVKVVECRPWSHSRAGCGRGR